MKNRVIKISKVLITIFIFIFLYYKYNINLTNIFTDISNWWMIVFGIFARLVIVQFIGMNRWKVFLNQLDIKESIWSLCKISFVSSFMGVVLPSSQGGDVMRMFFLEKKHGFSKTKKNTVSSSVLIERMFGFVLLSLISLISSFFLPDFPQRERVIIIILCINVALWTVILCLTNKRIYGYVSEFLRKFKRMSNVVLFIEKTHYTLVNFSYRKVLIPSIILIGLLQLTEILILHSVFYAYGVDSIPFYVNMSLYPIIAILSLLPISISGLGVRESFFIFFYGLLLIPADILIKVSLVNYFVSVFSAVIVGGVIYLLMQFNIIKQI